MLLWRRLQRYCSEFDEVNSRLAFQQLCIYDGFCCLEVDSSVVQECKTVFIFSAKKKKTPMLARKLRNWHWSRLSNSWNSLRESHPLTFFGINPIISSIFQWAQPQIVLIPLVFTFSRNARIRSLITLFPKVWKHGHFTHSSTYIWYVVYNWMSFEEAKWDEIKLFFKFSWVLYTV